MIAPATKTFRLPTPAWHEGFLAMLPAIVRHARVLLPPLNPEARQNAIQEVIANATVAYARLAELGKEDVAYPTPLATFAVAQYRTGRRVGNRLNVHDVLHPFCQRRKKITVTRLDHFDKEEGQWKEAVVQDTRIASVPQIVAFRCDFPQWLASHSRRDRRIAEALATGHTTGEVAKRFGVSAGRVSQLRRELAESWRKFHGEQSPYSPAARTSCSALASVTTAGGARPGCFDPRVRDASS